MNSNRHPEVSFYWDAPPNFACDAQMKLKGDPFLGNGLSPAMSKMHLRQEDELQEAYGRPPFPTEGDGKEQLPQDLLDLVDSLLQDDSVYLQEEEDQASSLLDLDLAAAAASSSSLWLDSEDFDPLSLEAMMGNEPSGPRSPRTKRTRPRTKKRQRPATALELDDTDDAFLLPHQQYYSPLLEEEEEEEGRLLPHYPATSSDETTTTTTEPRRRRRPRVSYSTLTEEEKYHRIRELNNEASKGYRQRRRQEASRMEQQEQDLRRENAVLRKKVNGLQELKGRVEGYCHRVLNQRYNQPS